MSGSSWKPMVNSLRMRLRTEPVLDDALVGRIANEIVARPFGNRSVQENLDAISAAAQTSEPLPHLVPSDHTDSQLHDFITRLAQRLEDLRPWPVPPYQTRPVPEMVDLSTLTPVARITEYQLTVQNHLKELFRDKDVNGSARGVLILQLKTGETVTLLGPADLQKAEVILFGSQNGDPQKIINNFQAITKFPADQIQGWEQPKSPGA